MGIMLRPISTKQRKRICKLLSLLPRVTKGIRRHIIYRMRKVTPIPFIRILLFLTIAFAARSQCRAVDIDSVLASPSSYHGKRVVLTGIARGDADRFYLFAGVR